MENHKVNSNEKLLNEADFMLAVLQTYEDIAYLKEKHRKLYSDKMQLHMLNQLVKLESFIDENKVDWEQLYNICLINNFSKPQIQVIQSLLENVFQRDEIESRDIVYHDLYKSFRALMKVSKALYKDVVDNINTNYYHSNKLHNSVTVKTADSLYVHYYNCQQLVHDFLISIEIELTDEQDAKLHKLLSESIFFYYVLEKEFFEKGLEMKDIVCFMEDKANIEKLQKADIRMIKFLGNNKGNDFSFSSRVIVEELKDICSSYLSRRLAVNEFDPKTWSELKKEKKFWTNNAQYNRKHLFNSFFRSVIQAFIDCNVAVKVADCKTSFDLVWNYYDLTYPVQLTTELASYAYDLLGKVMFSAVMENDINHKKRERKDYEFSPNHLPCCIKMKFVKARLKGNNDGYVTVGQDECNGFKIIEMNNSTVIREYPFNLIFHDKKEEP